jgi:hypothetical protein
MDWRNPSHIQELCTRLEARSRKGEIRDALQFFLRAARFYSHHLLVEEMRIQHRIDVWAEPGKGGGIVETLAIISDHKMAKAAFLQAVRDRPNARITMRHGARVIEQTHRDH